ncbi:universal stress protein [Haloprofundus sp. MHR1]|uniref:universal stress protein n=1 Tax=Haloprofundus sp. MHR1 TaxID=2572921 RepID=UPI0010BF32AD|nr:universal stress protein [Haloprofundus sp. MHR1]QCJ46336.1 universal stress protein [Haloprofundus sp. MHR1]
MSEPNSSGNTSLLAHPVVPVAGVDDAETTARAALPRIAAVGGEMLALYVVEKAGGAPDKASVEQREEVAEEAFSVVRELAAEAGVDVTTRVAYGTDVAGTILDVAADEDASAVVFTPRGGSKWTKLLTGDVASSLVEDADRPVVVLPASK